MKMKAITSKKSNVWPSIIAGVIVCVVVILIITTVSAGTADISRKFNNQNAFLNFYKMINTAWLDGGSEPTTYWGLSGVSGNAVGIVFIDNVTAKSLESMRACEGVSDSECVTMDSKAVVSKCITNTTDICTCLVSMKLTMKPCGFFFNKYPDVRKVIVVNSIAELKAWNQQKLLLFPYEEVMEIIDCKLLSDELACRDYYGAPCKIQDKNGYILAWIGADDTIVFETLEAEKPAGNAIDYLTIRATRPIEDPNPFSSPEYNKNIWKQC